MDDPRELFLSEQLALIVRDREAHMAARPDDRRVQRSRQLLQSALERLMAEKRFDKITVQDIIDRANVGRTTFYAHFQSKEDLFLSSHDELIGMLGQSFFSEVGTWRSEPSPQLIAFLELGRQNRDVYFYLTWGSDTGEVLRLLKERIAEKLAARLQERFREADSSIALVVLAQHVAGSIVTLISWWMGQRTPYSAHEMANMLHQVNLAALRMAFEKPA